MNCRLALNRDTDMSCTTAPLLSWISESLAERWCEHLARTREQRRRRQVDAYNLRRLQPRDLLDRSVTPAHFAFNMRARRAEPHDGFES